MKGANNGASALSAILLGIVLWIMPVIWVGLSPPIRPPFDASARTIAKVRSTKSVLDKFQKENSRTPLDLSEALAWARSKTMEMDRYDEYGNRFSYTRFSKNQYLLRSFGQDGRQTRFHGNADLAAVNFIPGREKSLQYKYSSIPTMDIYPAALLAGSEAPGKKWYANLHVDTETTDRTLMVYRREKPAKVMIAPHDRVEEFLWLPDGLRIVFTATGSSRYGDGVFLWHLVTDQVVNLAKTTLRKELVGPRGSENKLWISLAGINVNGPTVYVYAMPRVPSAALNPELFFNKSRLTAIRLPEGKKKPRLVSRDRLATLDSPPFAVPLNLSAHVDMTQMATIQKKWLDLSLHGDVEKVLVRWQEFSQKYNESVLFPYCLWYLSSIYAESYSVMRTLTPEDSEVLRSYGAELSAGLMNMETAPSYLRALGLYTYQRLMSGQPLPYRFAHLTNEPLAPTIPESVDRMPPEPKKSSQFPGSGGKMQPKPGG